MPQNRVKYSVVKTIKTIVGSKDSLGEDGDTKDTVVSTETLTTDVFSITGVPQDSKQLDTGTLAANNYIEYELRLWIDENTGNDSNLLIVFYVQIMPDDFVMQLHRF